ncbi:hypothetical protein VA596_29905 [Amycolatopsis sp., V23-08]|uniref:Ig-like domain-containing protein n=1 Tax=Amycolatopsis heterodermiae TaxID=3110235 RepID=A0ABU5RBZ6_9PSEU|nr:hypothetical protein [Amycolatopsis sp., V23-08]MEA5363781.1 hypothetical protein [Amycolatopsis sp., V23-08]
MAHDGGLSRELTALRRGWGLETEGLRGRVGPLLSAWCELHRTKNDREARRVLRDAVEAAIKDFPEGDQLAVRFALCIEPGAQHPQLSDRVEVLRGRLRVAERTARRRIDRAFARLAAEIEAETQCDPAEPDPDKGWFVRRLKAVVQLDKPVPTLVEERLIVATRDGLSRISAQFTVPRTEDVRDAERHVAAGVQYGVRMGEPIREGQRHFRWLLDLPRPLDKGEQHSYALEFQVDDGLPIRSSYAFIPLVTCESCSVRVRFHPDRLPRVVWRLDKVPQSVLSDPPQPGAALPLDGTFEVKQDFVAPQLGYAYGIRWLPHP